MGQKHQPKTYHGRTPTNVKQGCHREGRYKLQRQYYTNCTFAEKFAVFLMYMKMSNVYSLFDCIIFKFSMHMYLCQLGSSCGASLTKCWQHWIQRHVFGCSKYIVGQRCLLWSENSSFALFQVIGKIESTLLESILSEK